LTWHGKQNVEVKVLSMEQSGELANFKPFGLLLKGFFFVKLEINVSN